MECYFIQYCEKGQWITFGFNLTLDNARRQAGFWAGETIRIVDNKLIPVAAIAAVTIQL